MRLNWLLFKQGFKGIFNYKIQFFVIIILSFISAFYISTVVSLNNRIRKVYENVVENYEPFDYSFSKKIDSTGASKSTKTFVQLLDFINNDYVMGTKITGKEETGINFNLSSHGMEQYKNFLTNTIESDEFKLYFKDLYDANGDQWNRERGSIGDAVTTYWYNMDNKDYIYAANTASLDYSLGAYSETNEDGSRRQFVQNTTKLLVKNFVSEFLLAKTNESIKERYKNTLIFNYVEKNNQWNKLEELNNDLKDENIENFKNQTDFLKTYIWSSFEMIPYAMIRNILEHHKQIYTDVSNYITTESAKGKMIDGVPVQPTDPGNGIPIDYNSWNRHPDNFKFIYEKFLKDNNRSDYKIWFITDRNNPDADKNDQKFQLYNMVSDYEYFIGDSFFTNDNLLNADFQNIQNIVNSAQGNQITDTNLAINKDFIFSGNNPLLKSVVEGQNFDELTKNNKVITNKKTQGYLGQLNPLVVTETDGIVSKYIFSTDYKAMAREKQNQNYSSMSGGLGVNYSDSTILNRNIFSMENFHIKMNADVNNLVLNLREEALITDIETNIQYRVVILDENYDYNFEIIGGTDSISSNDILISQNFALANKIKVGKDIKVAGVNFKVKGYATDVLTYYPLVDPEVPISDPNTGAIIYTTKSMLQSIKDKGNGSPVIYSNNYYMNYKVNENIISEKQRHDLNRFQGFLMNGSDVINKSVAAITNPEETVSSSLNNINGLKMFSDTPSMLNWSLQPQIIETLNLVTIFSSIFIIFIVLLTITFAIKKTIEHNANQIAYLKAMGAKAANISISFLGYGILILTIVTPIGWLVGGFLQDLVIRLFSNFFSIVLYEFVFSWELLLGLLFVIGIGTLIFSYLISLVYTRKRVLDILNPSKKRKQKVRNNMFTRAFDKLPFDSRFSLKTASRGFNQVLMVVLTTFITSTIIVTAATIPNLMSNYIKDANKYFNYKNEYKRTQPFANSPLSKIGLSAWSGLEATESRSIDLNSPSFEKYVSTYFENPLDYVDSNYDTSFLPMMVYDGKQNNMDPSINSVKWMEEYAMGTTASDSVSSNEGEVPQGDFITLLLNSVMSRILDMNARTLSMGMFEKIYGYLLHTSVNPQSGIEIGSGQHNVSIRSDLISQAGSVLNEGVPQVISLIKIPGLDMDEIPADANWKEVLIGILIQLVPNSASKYITLSNNRSTQFNASLNSENYTPGKETLATTADFKNTYSSVKFTGLKSNQNSYMLDEVGSSKVFFDDFYELKKLESLIQYGIGPQEDIIIDGQKVYDSQTKVVTIPMVTNLKNKEKLEKYMNGDILSGMTSSVPTLLLKESGQRIPKGSWIYDNRYMYDSGVNWDDSYSIGVKGDKNSPEWMDPYAMDSSKFVTKASVTNGGLQQGSQFFVETSFDDNIIDTNHLRFRIRPQYNANNLKMFFPKSIIEDHLSLNNMDNPDGIEYDTQKANQWDATLTKWAGEVKPGDVPESVRSSWKKELGKEVSENFMWISPMSPIYSRNYAGKNGDIDFNQILNNQAQTWMLYAANESKNGSVFSRESQNIFEHNPNLKAINFKNVGTIQTYNDELAIVDQDLLNIVLGFGIDKYIPFDYSYFGNELYTYSENSVTTKIPVYEMHKIADLISTRSKINNVFGAKAIQKDREANGLKRLDDETLLKTAITNKWFTNKFSNFDEIYGLTSSARIKLGQGDGLFHYFQIDGSLNLHDIFGSEYSNIEPSSLKLGMTVTISEIILSISVVVISAMIIIGILILVVISDIYIMKYGRFMVVMKSLGYNRFKILKGTLGIPSIFSLIFGSLGIVLGVFLSSLAIELFKMAGIYIPFVISWWVPVIVFIGLVLFYCVSMYISVRKPLKQKPTLLMT